MEITLEEAFQGKTPIEIPVSVPANPLGHRRQGRHQAEDLFDVRRRRRVRQAQGFFTLERTCGLSGRGQMIEDPARPAWARDG